MRTMRGIAGAAMLALALTACGSTQQPLPQAPPDTSTSQDATPESTSEAEATPDQTAATACDVAREAILTGTKAQIKAAMKKLVADRTADATAREYARYYLGRDAADADMQEMDVSLIQMSCTL
jgi:predicted small lipoprotein YifL